MPYFRETSISFFWICGYNKLNIFNEEDLVLDDVQRIFGEVSLQWFWLPRADYVSCKGISGPFSVTIWYDREYISCHIGKIGVLWVHFLLWAPQVGHMQLPKCTVNICWVGVVIINIPINLPLALLQFRQWIRIERCGCKWAWCMIASSRCHFSHTFRNEVFFIIAGRMILFK